MPPAPKPRIITQPTLRIVVLHMESSARTDLLASGAGVVLQAVARLDKDGVGTVQSSAPDVVVLDLRHAPISKAASMIHRLREVSPQLRIVAVGPPGANAVAALTLMAGAHAYEGREVTPSKVLQAVRAAAAGTMHLNSTGKRAAQSLLRGSPAKPEREDGED